tara:strand:- start:702 stop:866 length:165 start_codon:yes stop_codon:yes gene_type:complete
MNELEKIAQKINDMKEKGQFGTPASPELVDKAWKELSDEVAFRQFVERAMGIYR